MQEGCKQIEGPQQDTGCKVKEKKPNEDKIVSKSGKELRVALSYDSSMSTKQKSYEARRRTT